jgi:hypothetical protein
MIRARFCLLSRARAESLASIVRFSRIASISEKPGIFCFTTCTSSFGSEEIHTCIQSQSSCRLTVYRDLREVNHSLSQSDQEIHGYSAPPSILLNPAAPTRGEVDIESTLLGTSPHNYGHTSTTLHHLTIYFRNIPYDLPRVPR